MTAVPALAVEDLSVEFRTRSGTVKVLEKVAFEVDKGETVALVGESGSACDRRPPSGESWWPKARRSSSRASGGSRCFQVSP